MHWLAIGILIGIVASPVLMILAVLVAAWCKAAFIEVREIWREAGYKSRLASYGRVPNPADGGNGYRTAGSMVNRQGTIPSHCLGEPFCESVPATNPRSPGAEGPSENWR